MVKDIRPGTPDSSPHSITKINGGILFAAFDDTYGQELWKSDGTEAGTVMVKDIRPGTSGSSIANLININGTVFFTAEDGVHGVELWKSDGTQAGTVMVKDINPGAANSNPEMLRNIEGALYFRAAAPVYGYELWRSDGTEAGTVLVKDIYPGTSSSFASQFSQISNMLLFTADDGIHGSELWALLIHEHCAESLAIGPGIAVAGSTLSASGSTVSSCAFNDYADVWYRFIPTTGGDYTVRAQSGNFDTTLAVYNACGGWELACNDDFDIFSTDSQLSLAMVKGKEYYIRVAGYNGQTGSFELTVTAGGCTEWLIADLNGDCTVDMQDLAILASQWLLCTKHPVDLCP